MSKSNPFSQFFPQNDFTKVFEQYQTLPFDLKEVMESHHKNMQAFTEAHQLAMESMQAVAQRQTEILSQMIEDNSNIAKEMMSEGTPEKKLAKNTEMFKKFYEKTANNVQELSDMISKSSAETGKLLNKRVSASMGEFKSALEKSQKKAA